jgi:hypothetical protein
MSDPYANVSSRKKGIQMEFVKITLVDGQVLEVPAEIWGSYLSNRGIPMSDVVSVLRF